MHQVQSHKVNWCLRFEQLIKRNKRHIGEVQQVTETMRIILPNHQKEMFIRVSPLGRGETVRFSLRYADNNDCLCTTEVPDQLAYDHLWSLKRYADSVESRPVEPMHSALADRVAKMIEENSAFITEVRSLDSVGYDVLVGDPDSPLCAVTYEHVYNQYVIIRKPYLSTQFWSCGLATCKDDTIEITDSIEELIEFLNKLWTAVHVTGAEVQ